MRTKMPISRPWVPTLRERKAGDDLPDGILGRIAGRACVYGVPDAYGTMFAAGCFDKTRAEKVASGKVPLFLDHDHETSAHVGVVRETPDVGNALMMYADLFDNDVGRGALDYCKSVLAAGAFTGLSVGIYEREGGYEPDPADAQQRIYAFKECELAEISITPMPAVPGAEVLHARRAPEERAHGLLVVLRMLLTSIPRKELLAVCHEFGIGELVTASAGSSPTGAASVVPSDRAIADAAVSMAERMEWARDRVRRQLNHG